MPVAIVAHWRCVLLDKLSFPNEECQSIASCQQRYSEIYINSTVLLSILFGIFQIIFIKDTVHCEIKARFQKCIVSIKSTVQNLCI